MSTTKKYTVARLLYLTPELNERLKQHSEDTGIPVVTWVRSLIIKALQEEA